MPKKKASRKPINRELSPTSFMLKKVASRLEPIELYKVPGLAEQFRSDRELLDTDIQDDQKLSIAIGYVLGYPMFRQAIGSNSGEDVSGVRQVAYLDLNRTHIAAIDVLMESAELSGLDSGPLVEFGRLCRELFENDSGKYSVGDFLAWPDCLGTSRTDLSQSYQDTICKGEAVIMRLNARLSIDPDKVLFAVREKIGQSVPAPISLAAGHGIPNPSAPFSLRTIAAAIGGDMTSKKLRPMIGRSIRGKELNRQTWIVCLDDMPVAARRKLAPTQPNSA